MVEIMYLLSNLEKKTNFGNFVWGEETKNEIDNPNFYFALYESPEIAMFLAPIFEKDDQFLIWEAFGEGEVIDEKIRKRFSKVQTKSLKTTRSVTLQQRINMAVLCSVNVVDNKDYFLWCVEYLKNKSSAAAKAEEILQILNSIECESEEINCAFPVVSSSVAEDQNKILELTASAIYRSFIDSFDLDKNINLDKISLIARMLDSQEIVSYLER